MLIGQYLLSSHILFGTADMVGNSSNSSGSQAPGHPSHHQHQHQHLSLINQPAASQCLSSPTTTSIHNLNHHSPAIQTNFSVTSETGSPSSNNNNIQQSMNILPSFIPYQPQQPMFLPTVQHNQQAATSVQYHPSTNTHPHQSANSSQVRNTSQPTHGGNKTNFQPVKRKKKKAKIDKNHAQAPSSDSSTPSSSSSSTDNSTSSTNTSSMINGAHSADINNSVEPGKGFIGGSTARCNTTEVTQQAIRFAETRFAFPPFIIKFKQSVDENLVIKYITNHFACKYNSNLGFAGHRLKDKRELLLFVNIRESFIMLFDDQKWPTTIESLNYEKILPNHLPPQFSIVLRNVPTDINTNELLTNIKNEYNDITNAHRILNKNNQPTSFIRLDIKNVNVLDELLGKKFIYFNNIRLGVTEYLAPAKVLVCSKCFQIGHFRATCKNTLEICRICGAAVNDINQHKQSCDKKICCTRCKGAHEANDVRCPDIKTYHAVLTKSLLASTNRANNHHQQSNTGTNFRYNDQDFPLLNVNNQHNQHKSLNPSNYSKQIDELFNKVDNLNQNLNRLLELNNNYLEQLTRTQQMITKHDHMIQLQQLDNLFNCDYVKQFVTPVCQMMIEIIPSLVKQKSINDKTLSYSSLTSLCEKLAHDLPTWTNRFTENENVKLKLNHDHNMFTQLHSNFTINMNDPPPTTNQ